MGRNDDQLIAYLEQRDRRRRDALRNVLIAITIIVVGYFAIRTFLHVTGIGAKTTVSVTLGPGGGVRTTQTPVSILP